MSSDDIAKGVKQTTGTAPVLLTIRSAHNPEWLKRPARQQVNFAICVWFLCCLFCHFLSFFLRRFKKLFRSLLY